MTESPTQHPPLEIDVVAQAFTSTGGFVFRAVESTQHAGKIPCLFASSGVDVVAEDDYVEFVRLEVDEAAEIGLWLLRLVADHLTSPQVRAAVKTSLDRASRMIGEGLAE